jgi:M-phase inducer tyrosine phosphatase
MTDPLSLPFTHLKLIDVRFPYEFAGGAIKGAKRITTIQGLHDLYARFRDTDTGFVFYCEFSQSRSPQMLDAFRQHDRRVHFGEWPKLSCPNVYLLLGGYKEFHRRHPRDCTGGYVAMRDKRHVRNGNLARCHGLFRREMMQSPAGHRAGGWPGAGSQPNIAVDYREFGIELSGP